MPPVFNILNAPIACPGCGFSEVDFAKTMRLGCPQCYETFRVHLSTMLPKMHAGETHRGKTPPRRAPSVDTLCGELAEIEALLANAPAESRAAANKTV